MTPIAHEKSTNVRPAPWTIRALRLGFRALEAGSPALAARVGEGVMFRTMRRPPSKYEQTVLATGRRFFVHAPSARVTAWRFGEGPVVVLVHGWNGRGAQLGAFIAPLVESGFSVVTFDAPGHGVSEGSTSSLVEFADAFDAVLDEVRPLFGPVHAVVAHSMGGAAVTYAASRFRHLPEVEVERALREFGRPIGRFVFIAPPIDLRDFVHGFSQLVGLGKGTEHVLTERLESRFAIRMEDLYAPALAREMRAPMFLVHDANDREVPLRCGQLLAASWPGATIDVTEGLGHLRILRDAGVVSRVTAFITKGDSFR